VSEVVLRLGRVAMGSQFEVIVRGERSDWHDLVAAAAEALDEAERLEQQLSHYVPTSDICDLNARAGGEPVRVEPHLFRLLQRAEALSRDTEGAFDITAGPLVQCWGFFRGEGRIPDPRELGNALNLVGMKNVELDEESQTVRFRREGVQLHLGAIGKGYAVERAGQVLRGLGVPGALVHGGYSSIEAVGLGPGDEPWQVGLKDPLRDRERLAAVGLENCALSTSGSTGDFFLVDGRRLCHILDPRTGWPVEGMLSASVIAPSGTESDALATAVFILGPEGARRCLATRPETAAVLIPEPAAGEPLEMIRIDIEFEEEVAA
jgi:thiamine biosynthesis lipoprotein